MAPLQGLNGWQWIFIMQAVLTFIIGILCMIFVVDFPDRAYKAWGFLSEKECAFVLRRLNRDRADASPEPFSLGKFLRPALDLKIWAFAFIFLSVSQYLSCVLSYLTAEQRPDNPVLRHRLLPPHHPPRQHGLQCRSSPVSGRTPICPRRNSHGCNFLGRR